VKIARGGWSHISVGVVIAGLGWFSLDRGYPVAGYSLLVAGAAIVAFMVYFFRDPERASSADPSAILSGADGWVRSVERISEARYLKRDTVRISVYLTDRKSVV